MLKLIKEQKAKTVAVQTIEKRIRKIKNDRLQPMFYKELADIFIELESDEVLTRVKSSKVFGRDSRIQEKYKKVEVEMEDFDELKSELKTKYHPRISTSHYFNDIQQYRKQRGFLESISDFLLSKDEYTPKLSLNERSYELFGDEKFLDSAEGSKLLSIIRITLEELLCYKTYEPFFHFDIAEKPEDNVLIIENLDTYNSFKALFRQGIREWKGIYFTMLIYGEGNKITRSYNYLKELEVPETVSIYYFGDLDPEGIWIYHQLADKNTYNIKPMKIFYEKLFERRRNGFVKKRQCWRNPAMKHFFKEGNFENEREIYEYLQRDMYVPQEGLNIEVLRRITNG